MAIETPPELPQASQGHKNAKADAKAQRLRFKTVVPIVIGLALAMGACGGSDAETASSENADQALQERLDKLEGEAKEREAEAAKAIRVAKREAQEVKRKARKAKREAEATARKAKREAEANAQEEAAVAPDAGVDQTEDSGGGGITVPDVVGLDHQAAQDALQGEGLWSLDEEDCTGQDRLLLFDRNWEVVSTDPPAGSQVGEDTTVTICSEKQGE